MILYGLLDYVSELIKDISRDILGDYQAGFRQNRSTMHQIFILKQIFKKKHGSLTEKYMYCLSISRMRITAHKEFRLNILRQFKLPQKFIDQIN